MGRLLFCASSFSPLQIGQPSSSSSSKRSRERSSSIFSLRNAAIIMIIVVRPPALFQEFRKPRSVHAQLPKHTSSADFPESHPESCRHDFSLGRWRRRRRHRHWHHSSFSLVLRMHTTTTTTLLPAASSPQQQQRMECNGNFEVQSHEDGGVGGPGRDRSRSSLTPQ